MIDRRAPHYTANTKQQLQVEEAYRIAGPDGDKVVEIIRAQLNRVDERKKEEIALLYELERRARLGENVLLSYPQYRLTAIDRRRI
jgi:hypothetical protein